MQGSRNVPRCRKQEVNAKNGLGEAGSELHRKLKWSSRKTEVMQDDRVCLGRFGSVSASVLSGPHCDRRVLSCAKTMALIIQHDTTWRG